MARNLKWDMHMHDLQQGVQRSRFFHIKKPKELIDDEKRGEPLPKCHRFLLLTSLLSCFTAFLRKKLRDKKTKLSRTAKDRRFAAM